MGDPSLRVLLPDLPVFQVIPILPAEDLPFPPFQRFTEQVPSSVISIAFPPVYAVRPVDDPLFCQPPISVIGSADLIPVGRGDLCQVPGLIISVTGDSRSYLLAVPLDPLFFSHPPSVFIIRVSDIPAVRIYTIPIYVMATRSQIGTIRNYQIQSSGYGYSIFWLNLMLPFRIRYNIK